jgi:hypothetical protein
MGLVANITNDHSMGADQSCLSPDEQFSDRG